MLYAAAGLGVLGALTGAAVAVGALVSAVLRGGTVLPAALALLCSVVALAGAAVMHRHLRKAALLDAACGAAGALLLPQYFGIPAALLALPAVLCVAMELRLRGRVTAQVRDAARRARMQQQTALNGTEDAAATPEAAEARQAQADAAAQATEEIHATDDDAPDDGQ